MLEFVLNLFIKMAEMRDCNIIHEDLLLMRTGYGYLHLKEDVSPGDTEYNQVCKRLTLTSINVYHAKTAQEL